MRGTSEGQGLANELGCVARGGEKEIRSEGTEVEGGSKRPERIGRDQESNAHYIARNKRRGDNSHNREAIENTHGIEKNRKTQQGPHSPSPFPLRFRSVPKFHSFILSFCPLSGERGC